MIKNALKIMISLGLLALLITRVEWPEVVARAGHLSWWTLPLAVVMQMAVWALSNCRWWLLIRVHNLGHTFGNLFKPTYIGAFFNNLLPSSTGGDLFRMYHIYRQGHGAAVAVSPVVTERLIGLISMIALATVSIHQFSLDTHFFAALRTVLLWMLICGAAGLAVVSIPATYYALHGFLARWSGLKVVEGLLGITEAAHTYLRRPALVASLVAISLLLQALQIVIFMILGAGVHSSLEATQYLFIVPIILVAASIPVSVGGLGVRETAAVTLFVAAGMSQENAAAISLLYIPVLVLSAVPGLWFFLRMREYRQFYRKATQTDFSETKPDSPGS